MQNVVTGVNKIARATATVRDQATYVGECLYQFVAADVDTAAYYSEEWELLWPGGYKESFPTGESVSVHIMPDLDSA